MPYNSEAAVQLTAWVVNVFTEWAFRGKVLTHHHHTDTSGCRRHLANCSCSRGSKCIGLHVYQQPKFQNSVQMQNNKNQVPMIALDYGPGFRRIDSSMKCSMKPQNIEQNSNYPTRATNDPGWVPLLSQAKKKKKSSVIPSPWTSVLREDKQVLETEETEGKIHNKYFANILHHTRTLMRVIFETELG